MAHRRKVTDADAAKFAELYQAGYSTREVARATGFSQASVSRHLNSKLVETRTERTETATRARSAWLRDAIAANAVEVMRDVENLRSRMYSPCEVVANGVDGPEVVVLEEPPLRDVADAMRANTHAVAGVEKSLEKLDGRGGDQGASVIDALVSGISSLVERSGDAGVDPRDQDSSYDIAADPEVWDTPQP